MSGLSAIFLNTLLPIFLASTGGYLLGKYLKVDPGALSRVVFYILSPCLVFTLLTQNKLSDGDILRMMGFAVLLVGILGTLTWLICRLLRLNRQLTIGVLLTTMLMNAGNYGLPVNSFAFGDEALAQASLFFIAMGILSYTVGVIIASLGSFRPAEAFLGLFKLPLMYALILALVFNRTNWVLPLPIERTTSLLAEGAVPAMLVLLGLQLQRARLEDTRTPAFVLTNFMRLVASPLLAIGLAILFNVRGPARQAAIVEAAMPAAVMTTVLATEYGVVPSFVTATVFTTTLLSPLTLTPLIAFLGGSY